MVSAVPYLLGFHPERSLVLIGLDASRLTVTAGIDLDAAIPPALADVRTAITATPGVAGVHDLHLWGISSEDTNCSVHVQLSEGADPDAVRRAVASRLEADFDVHHATIQTEREVCEDVEHLHP